MLSNLGDNWTSAVFSEDKNQTAIISKIGKGSEAFRVEVADISMVAFEKDGNLVRYVSCNSPSGRKSQERRELVDWLLKQYRKENELLSLQEILISIHMIGGVSLPNDNRFNFL